MTNYLQPPADLPAASHAAWTALCGPDGEYEAIASYTAVIEKFGECEPYVSILAAEKRHAAALTRQLMRRAVPVPQNPYLGTIPAPDSLAEAAIAWAEGEVANVQLYDELIAQAQDDPQIVRVFGNLRRSSLESHLPAFRAAAKASGTLDQMPRCTDRSDTETVTPTVQASGRRQQRQGHGHGRGRAQRNGRGRGRGQRQGRTQGRGQGCRS